MRAFLSLFLCGHTHQTSWALPVFSLSSALNGPCALMWLARWLLFFFFPARLDQYPLIWRGHGNNCSRQTGRRKIAPAVIFNQLYLTSRDTEICRKNFLWLTVTVHDLEFISKFLRIEENLKCINNMKQAFQHHMSCYQVTYQRSFSADVSLLIEWFVCLFTGKPMSENPQGSISCTNDRSFKSIAIYWSRGWNPSLGTQEVGLSAQMKNKPIRRKQTESRRKRYQGHRVFKGQQRWTSSLCVRQDAASRNEPF